MLDRQALQGCFRSARAVPCYLWGANYRLGAHSRAAESLEGLDSFFAANGLPADLGQLGMGRFCEADEEDDLAQAAAQGSLATCESGVDAVILCSSRFRGEASDHAVAMHRLLTGLGIEPAFTAGVTMNRCASFLSGLRLAEAMVRAGQAQTCLAITSDRCNSDAERLRPFALFSDGAASCLVGATPGRGPVYRIAGSAGATDAAAPSEAAQISSTMVRRANTALAEAGGLSITLHGAVLPTNVFSPIVTMVEALGGARPAAIYLANVVRLGHVFAADPLGRVVNYGIPAGRKVGFIGGQR